MFLKMKRKSREPSEQKGDADQKGKPDQGATEAGDNLVTQISALEEMTNERTKNLEETKEELNQLANASELSAEDKNEAEGKEELAQPHGPKAELVVESEDGETGKEKDLNVLLGEVNEQEGEQEKEGDDDSLSNLFDQEEEEINPLAGLISALPSVTAEELLNEARAIEATLGEGQPD